MRLVVDFIDAADSVAVDVVITEPEVLTACTMKVPAGSPSRLYIPDPLVIALPTMDPLAFRALTLTPVIGPAGPPMVPEIPPPPDPADRLEICVTTNANINATDKVRLITLCTPRERDNPE